MAAALAESARLGLGEPVALSAETGEGMLELYAALRPLVDAAQEELTQQAHHAQHAHQGHSVLTTNPSARKTTRMGMSALTYGMAARMAWPAPLFAPARDSILTDMVLVVRVLPSTTDLR